MGYTVLFNGCKNRLWLNPAQTDIDARTGCNSPGKTPAIAMK